MEGLTIGFLHVFGLENIEDLYLDGDCVIHLLGD
jgi:hypothetical protein